MQNSEQKLNNSQEQALQKANVSSRLYGLVDRLQKHSEWKYPERKWTAQFYYDCAFAWMGKEDELEKRVLMFEKDMQAGNGC
jgi:hypothetical protein